jgi:hypothetical protein
VVKEKKKSYTLYSILYQLSKRGFYHSKWLLEIKNTLYECGLNVMWDDQRIAKSDYISKNVKKCLSHNFIQNWNNNVMNSAKCLNYRIYKSNSVLSNIYQCYPLIYECIYVNYGFLFRSEIFSQNLTLGYDKNSESDLHWESEYFF